MAGKAIAYDSHAYPYFFFDTDGNGVADQAEAKFPNQYKAWTPRLLKPTYNYQFVAKDPGNWNGRCPGGRAEPGLARPLLPCFREMETTA